MIVAQNVISLKETCFKKKKNQISTWNLSFLR